MPQRKKKFVKENRINSPALVQMRDVAFGPGMSQFLLRQKNKDERARNDAGMMQAAELKNERKLERNRKNAKNAK